MLDIVTLPSLIKLECPRCRRWLKPANLMTSATLAVDRTCPRCRSRWRAVIRPLRVDRGKVMAVHQIDWSARP